MAKLILHSDDFGLHDSINQAVLQAAGHGVLTSCSLMANGLAAEDAVKKAFEVPDLGVGIHLNILRGRPLSDPEDVPSLVDGNGLFLNSALKLATRSVMKGVSRFEVYQEYRRQVDFMIQKGIVPTHVDSEKHTHLWLPEAAWATGRVMKAFGISKVRFIRETPMLKLLRRSKAAFEGDFLQRIKLIFLENRANVSKKNWAGAKSPDYFFGVCISGGSELNIYADIFKVLNQMPPDTVIEWMFHLGFNTPGAFSEMEEGFGKYFLTTQREDETRMLLSEGVMAEIKKNQTNLISYRHL
jgi:predicted glycoside hydrolase/deacetylase ChbG (UPF0249 family)